jgi:hypothetical protein
MIAVKVFVKRETSDMSWSEGGGWRGWKLSNAGRKPGQCTVRQIIGGSSADFRSSVHYSIQLARVAICLTYYYSPTTSRSIVVPPHLRHHLCCTAISSSKTIYSELDRYRLA